MSFAVTAPLFSPMQKIGFSHDVAQVIPTSISSMSFSLKSGTAVLQYLTAIIVPTSSITSKA